MLLLVYAISNAPNVGWGTTRTISLLVASASLLGSFIVIETRVEAPLMPLRIFRLKTLAGANAVGFLLGASFFAFIFIGTLYMQQVLGYSALQTGLAWLATSVTSVAFAGVSQATRHARLAEARDGGWHGADRNRPALDGSGRGRARTGAASSGRSSSPGWDGIRVHPSLDRRTRRSRRPRGRSRLGPAEHVTAARWRDRCRRRIHGHRGPHERAQHQGATATAALSGGLQWALWVCGAIALVAIPVTFLLVRSDELEQAVEAATATA